MAVFDKLRGTAPIFSSYKFIEKKLKKLDNKFFGLAILDEEDKDYKMFKKAILETLETALKSFNMEKTITQLTANDVGG